MAILAARPRAGLRSPRREICCAVVAAVLWAAGSLLGPAAAADGYSEAAVKAAFLYRFAGYVEWPSSTSSAEPFTIAVLQADAVGAQLQRFLPGHLINGRVVRTRTIKSIQELADAQMLYVGSLPQGSLRLLLAPIKEKAVLVVTDDEHGLEQGGMINFLTVDQRIRFEVSLVSTDRAGLKISAELLSVAARVEGERLRSDAACVPSETIEELPLNCPLRVAAR